MTAGHGEKLTRKQEEAIAALLLHPTLATAAKAAGIGQKTLWRWLRLEGFQTAYHQARREAISRAVGRLQYASTQAVKTLEAVMKQDDSPAAQVTAARTVLEFAFRAVEWEDLERRVKELEKTS
jgi:hypothetical protein